MDVKKKNDLLEETLSLAETDYAQAYRFLLAAYEKSPETLARRRSIFWPVWRAGRDAGMRRSAGSERPSRRTAGGTVRRFWWTTTLRSWRENSEFIALKARSDARYREAVSAAKSVFSWNGKTADYLFLAVHGNTQNAQTARADWAPILAGDNHWQLETIQSAEPDGYGTFRWSYDDTSFLPVANALMPCRARATKNRVRRLFGRVRYAAARHSVYPARCDLLILQSPWIPVLQEHKAAILQALRQSDIASDLLRRGR